MNLCYLDNAEVVVLFPYDAELIASIKDTIPQGNRRYDKGKQAWVVMIRKYGSINEQAIKALEEFLKAHDFKQHISVRNYLSDLREKIAEEDEKKKEIYQESKADDSIVEVEGLGGELRPFQKAGVSYLAKRGRAMLGDEMGLGKTIQAIAAVVHSRAYPSLILCPVSLQLNWIREIEKWAVGKRVSGEAEKDADFLVIPYSQLPKHEQLLKKGTKWASLICDESHYLKNRKAQRTKAVRSISKGIPSIYLLTGTPILNRPSEFITQLQILERLNELGGWKHFTERYCDAKQERFGLNINGATNLEELNKKLRNTCYIRRFKTDVLKELPDKQRTLIEVKITNRREYETARKGVRQELVLLKKKSRERTQEVMSEVEEFTAKKIKERWGDLFPNDKIPKYNDKRKLKRGIEARMQRRETMVENSEGVLLVNRLKILAMQGKLDSAEEWIEDFLESGEKLVVFCEHIEAQHKLFDKFKKKGCAILSSMDTADRQASVDRFQTDDKCRVIICSLGAGGVGFTMTAASNVLFVEMGWTPAMHDQAEDRTHRIGQENAVTAYYLIGTDTIDKDIYNLLETKRKVVSAASDGMEVEQGSMVRDLLDKLAGLDDGV